MTPKQTFSNTDPSATPSLSRLFNRATLDWLMTPGSKRSPQPTPVAEHIDPGPVSEPSVTWLGHASSLIALGGLRLITDPVLSPRLGPTVKRRAPVPIEPEALPDIDLVLISHNHRDHLDEPTIRRIEARFTPHYITPLGVDAYLTKWGVAPERVATLGWWEAIRPTPERSDLQITLVPAQHWSQRGLLDRNTSLWGGFVLEHPTHTVYFAGDSGYCDDFKEIGARFPNIDTGLIPIGAYEPRWFMRQQHMNPEEAGQVMLDVGARRLIPIHWGTYKLTTEPFDEPPARLRAWGESNDIAPERLAILPIGGRLTL